MCRCGAVLFLSATLFYGLLVGGHLDDPRSPAAGLGGRIASYFGYAAEDITIAGLSRHTPEALLAALGVEPGGSLIGFDARHSRRLLENIDWIKSAKLRRVHPNRLEIEITERQPIAIWQRDGEFYVIDADGAAMSSLSPAYFRNLLIVTGEGAQQEVAKLVNQLEAWPRIKSRVKAAARVGQRRWTLYLDNNVKVALPEKGIETALQELARLQSAYRVFDKGISMIDFRIAGHLRIGLLGES